MSWFSDIGNGISNLGDYLGKTVVPAVVPAAVGFLTGGPAGAIVAGVGAVAKNVIADSNKPSTPSVVKTAQAANTLVSAGSNIVPVTGGNLGATSTSFPWSLNTGKGTAVQQSALTSAPSPYPSTNPTPSPAPPTVSWWDQYKWWVIGGGSALVVATGVVVATSRRRY